MRRLQRQKAKARECIARVIDGTTAGFIDNLSDKVLPTGVTLESLKANSFVLNQNSSAVTTTTASSSSSSSCVPAKANNVTKKQLTTKSSSTESKSKKQTNNKSSPLKPITSSMKKKAGKGNVGGKYSTAYDAAALLGMLKTEPVKMGRNKVAKKRGRKRKSSPQKTSVE